MDKKERINKAFEYLKSKGIIHTQRDLGFQMGAAEGNISRALKGDPKVLTEQFLTRFARTYNNVFYMEWVLDGIGEMLILPDDNKPCEQSQNEMSDGMLELYARLIRGVDDIRMQLKEELKDVRAAKIGLQQARDDFKDATSRLIDAISYIKTDSTTLMVADDIQIKHQRSKIKDVKDEG